MHFNRDDSIKKIQELTEGIDFCMLTTIDGGVMRSRPMSTQQTEFDGDLWFFTSDRTHKIANRQTDAFRADFMRSADYVRRKWAKYLPFEGTSYRWT